MTLIIGLKCKDAVVLATDSQITTGTSKRTDSAKIETVSFKHFPVLVAQSGDLVLSNRFVDIFAEFAKIESPTDVDEVGRLAQNAMMKLRGELREMHFGCNSEELSNILLREGTQVGIMIGFFLHNKAHLITLNLAHAIYRKSRFYYEADGCGATLGQYLLAEHTTPDMKRELATTVAVYVVELVKQHDAFCGGPTKVGVLLDHELGTSVGTYRQEAIENCAKRLLEIADADRPARLNKFLQQASSKAFILEENVYIDDSLWEAEKAAINLSGVSGQVIPPKA